MSAQATFPGGHARSRFRFLETIAGCGLPVLSLVLFGGTGAGLALWYLALTHFHGANEAFFVAGLTVGLAATFVGWYVYAAYFARRANVGIATALRWDSASVAMLGFYLLGFVAPVGILPPSRAAALALALFALVKVLVAARFVHTVRDVLITFITTRVAIIVIAELAAIVIAQRPGTHVSESENPLLAAWGRWDAVHYLDIARRGYYGTDVAFFPLYPALIFAIGKLAGSELIAGLLISNAALFFGLLFFYKLVEHQYTRAVAHRAIFYISIFPTAVFFSAVYTESLFFALTVASFYYIREHKWLAAGILGAFAALTRSEGVLLIVPYAIELFAAARAAGFARFFAYPWRTIRIGAGALAIGLGLAAYMAWLWALTGDPMAFSKVQVHWDRHFAPPWVAFAHSFRVIAAGKGAITVSNEALELAFTVLMIVVLAAGVRRLRPSFTAYMALSILVPLCTSSLMSMPRFALVLFPMFVILALWGGRSWVNNSIVAFSLPLLGLFTVFFADWYWVA